LAPLFNPHQRNCSITVKFNPTIDPQTTLSRLTEIAVFYFHQSVDPQGFKITNAIKELSFYMGRKGAVEVLRGWGGGRVLSPAMVFPPETKVLVMMMGCVSKDHQLMKCFDDPRYFSLNRVGLENFEDVLWLTVYRAKLQKLEVSSEAAVDRYFSEDDGVSSDDAEDVPF
jgi:hypothetical protein